MKHPRTTQGMSIIEILLASALFIVVATSIITLILQSYTSNRLSNEVTIASQYAAEGLEAVRDIRNQSYALLSESSGTGVAVSSGTWTLSGASTTFDKYTRVIAISTVNRDSSGNITSTGTLDPDTKKIVSTVTWNTSPSRVDSVAQTTYLTNWRASLWYNSSWLYRKQITIDHTKVASSTGTEGYASFPILVNTTTSVLAYTGFGGGHVGNATGSDILFTAANGTTKLNHEIESYTSSTGNLVAWVNVGASGLSTSTDTKFYMYYGNAGAADQQNVTSTWDASYKGVWHLPNGTSLTTNDSTGNANNASNIGTSPPGAGQIDGAASFNATTQYLSVADNAGLRPASGITLSVWARPATTTAFATIITKSDAVSGDWAYKLDMDSSSHWRGYVQTTAGGLNAAAASAAISTGQWYFLAYTYDQPSHTSKLYINNSVAIVNTSGGTGNISYGTDTFALGIAAGIKSSVDSGFNGVVDEARISDFVRSADWINTEYGNQNNPGTFFTLGTEQTPN